MMSIVGPVERSLSWAPAAAPWALLPAWQETLGWSGAESVSWGIFLDFREVGRRNCTGKKTRVKQNTQPCLPSMLGSADTQVMGGKHPLFHGNWDGSHGQGGAQGCAFFVIYSEKSKVRAACWAGLLRTLAEEAPK